MRSSWPYSISWRERLLAGLVFWHACAGGLQSATYYVSGNGSNANPGTLTQPFRTIGHAIGQCVAGDEVVVRGGVYRDPIVPTRSGTEGAPIRVRPFHDGADYEVVEVRGLVPIVENTDGAGAWQVHDPVRNIYRIQLTEDWDLKVGTGSTPSNQVFADGQILIEARWPNIGSYSNMRETDWALGRGSFTGTANPYTGNYTATGLSAFAANALAGATLVFSPGQRWFVQQAIVSANSGSSLQFSFNKNTFSYGFHMPDDGDRFYLTKSLALLDAPGEWFFDSATNILYVRMPADTNPAAHIIEMRRHDRFLDLTSSSHLRFENLRFTAAYIFSGTGNHGFIFSNCQFQHLTNGFGRSGLFLNGNNNRILDCTFLGDAGTPVHLRDGTTGNIVENCVIGDAHYLDGFGPALSVQGAQSVRRNTVFNAGGHGISVMGNGAAVQRNRVYYFGTLVQDVAGINAFGGGNQGGARWSYNMVHDGLAGYGDFPGNNGSMGIRIDNGGATRACYNVVIHHNLIWGVTNSALNIWGVQDSQLAPGDTQANVNIRLINNTAIGPSKMVGRDADGFKFTGICWRNNILDGLLSGPGNTSLNTATIQTNLLRSNTIANNTTGVASFADPANNDYQLQAGSPGVNAGALLPPYTDGATDGQPDLGAFERGQLPWRAGATITAADLKNLTLSAEGQNTFVLTGLPIGRTVPDAFRVRLGGTRLSSSNLVVESNLATHQNVVHLSIDSTGLTGNQLVEYTLDGTTFLNPGQFINLSGGASETVEAPSHLSFYNPSNDTVTLLWRDNSTNEESFVVHIASDLNFSADFQAVSVPANETVRVFSGLTPDKTYYFRVQAKNSTLGDSVFSPIASVRVGRMGLTIRHPDDDGTEFAIPFDPVLLNGASALITITSPAVTALRFAEVPIPAGATISEANLQFKTGVEYLNTVARVRFTGERVANSLPLIAQQYNLRNRLTNTPTTATVAWDNIPPWYKDEVTPRQMSPNLASILQEIISLPGWQSGNALTLLAQDNGSSSWEASRSFSTADDSLSNTTLFVRFTTPPAPTQPVNDLMATETGQTTIALSWSYGGSGHLGFWIERSTHEGRRFEIVARPGPGATSYTDSGLLPDTRYYYRLRAWNGGGVSPASAVASAKTSAPVPPTAPVNLSAAPAGINQITLTWSDTSLEETGFLIERSATGTMGSFTLLASVAANVTSYSDLGLPPGTRYFYRVRATNGGLNSPYTSVVTAATNDAMDVVSNPTTGWYRGMLGSSPASSLTVQNGTELAHFTGGSGWDHAYHAQFWRYFTPVTLADGETLRLSVTFAYTNNGTRPNIDRALRFALLNSNNSQTTADITGNNSPHQTEDYGYGIALASGTNTTSRYIEERPTETASAPLRTEMRDLGANSGSWSVNDGNNHTLVLDLRRQGSELHLLATIDGAPFDGGRVVTSPHTFTYDMVMLANRTRGVTWIVRSIAVEKHTPVPALHPLTAWRLAQFGFTDNTGSAADNADPDADGLANLLEYALGGNPNQNNPGLQPVVGTTLHSGQNRLTLTFTPAETAGLRYVVEASPDLSNWIDQTDVTDLQQLNQPYTFIDTADLGTVPRRFLRLRVIAQ